MYLKNKIRVTAAICSACMLCGTAAEFSVHAVNYGTTDNYIIGEKGMSYINAVDEDGNYIDINSGIFQMCSESGEEIAQWCGNNPKTFSIKNSKYKISSITNNCVSLSIDDIPDVIGNEGTLYSVSINNQLFQQGYKKSFEFGKTYDTIFKYFSNADNNTVLVVPPHSFCVAADAGWAQKKIDWWFDIENYDADNIHFRDLAGKQQLISMPDGNYPYCLGYTFKNSSGSGGNIYNRNTISDQSSEYALKRIKLSDIYPSDFNSNGIHTHDFFGKIYNYNFGIDDEVNGVSACIIFISGNVITAPIPDAEGYVNIYVDKSTNDFSLITNYIAGSASGGGKTGSTGYPVNIKKFTFSTPSVPDQGIVLSGVDDGKYIVKALSLPDEYEAADSVLTVGPASDGLPKCTLTAKRKRYSVKELKSQNGTVTVNNHYNQAVKGQIINLQAVPDKGYRFKKYRVTDIWDDEFELDKDELNKNGTFCMPGEDTFVQGIFEVNFGDINLDNSIDASDMILLRKHILSDETDNLPVTADMNSNGKINIFDHILLMRMLVSSNPQQ